MLPASPLSPPYIFSPRRRPALSRPFREDPPAFLCAVVVTLSNSLWSSYTDSVKESSPFFVPFAAGFFAFVAGFLPLAAVFLPLLPLAALVSPSPPSASVAASRLGLASRLGRRGGGCVGLLA